MHIAIAQCKSLLWNISDNRRILVHDKQDKFLLLLFAPIKRVDPNPNFSCVNKFSSVKFIIFCCFSKFFMATNNESTTAYKTILSSQENVISQPNTGTYEEPNIYFFGFQFHSLDTYFSFFYFFFISVVMQMGLTSYFATEQYFRNSTDYRLVTLSPFRMPIPTTFVINEYGQTCVIVNEAVFAVLPQSEVLR